MESIKSSKPLSDVIEGKMEFAGSIAGDAVEFVGAVIDDALHGAGNRTFVGPLLYWLGGVLKAPFNILGAIIKGVTGIIGGFIGGIIKIVSGLLHLKWSRIAAGIWDFFSPGLGAIIMIAGKTVGFLQSLFYLQAFERPLTDAEKLELKSIFGNSLNYYVIRIVAGHTGLFGLSGRPFTLGNTILVKKWKNTVDLIVHETTHVWQNRYLGNRYISDAIVAQWFVKDAYNWQKEISERKKEHWIDFNGEAQAAFVEHLWKNGTDYTDIAKEAVRIIRNEKTLM